MKRENPLGEDFCMRVYDQVIMTPIGQNLDPRDPPTYMFAYLARWSVIRGFAIAVLLSSVVYRS
jgi:hypothetical protein